MRKATMIAGAMALIGGAMIGATVVPEPDVHTSRNVSAKEGSTPAPKQQESAAVKPDATVITRWVWPDEQFAVTRRVSIVRRVANWSQNTGSSFNRIKHGRSTRRKHRRS